MLALKKLIRTQKEIEKLYNLKSNENNDKKQIENILQQNNINFVLFDETKETILTIWNKYKDKQFGEKTEQKIKTEIENAFDNEIFVYFNDSEIEIVLRDETKQFTSHFERLVIYPKKYDDRFLIGNKIQERQSNEIYINIKNYIDNLEQTAQELLDLHKKALKKRTFVLFFANSSLFLLFLAILLYPLK